MTKDVLVSISGLHMDMDAQIPGPDEDDVIEVVTPATYYYRNGKHYIIYDEIVEGVSDTIKNKIKISGTDSLEIMKSGLSNTHMIFEKNKKNLTYYKTLYGQMLVGLNTRNMEIEVSDETIKVRVDYELDVNHEPLANCKIRMNIVSKGSGIAVIKKSTAAQIFCRQCSLSYLLSFLNLAKKPFFFAFSGASSGPRTPFTAVM